MSFENCYFLIPARKGSKGFPFKNRKLFAFTADTIPPEFKDQVFVSTDDELIKEQSVEYGFNVVDRPADLSKDSSSFKDAMVHFIESKDIPDDAKIIVLFLTYPQRNWTDIESIYRYFLNKEAKSLICCEEVRDHPYLCFYEREGNRAELVIDHSMYRRQDYPKCVRQSMFFACYEASTVTDICDLLFEKNTIFYKLNEHKVDVDYEEDLCLT